VSPIEWLCVEQRNLLAKDASILPEQPVDERFLNA
jgi:hypothetical protein